MFKKHVLLQAIAAAFFAASAAGNFALAQVIEVEPNGNAITSAQHIDVPDGGVVQINGSIVNSGSIADIDWYTFEGGDGSVLTIDIDNAAIALRTQPGFPGVDTMVAVYGPDGSLYQNNDGGVLDQGSFSTLDAYLQTPPLPGGTYIVGVTVFGKTNSGSPKVFLDGGNVSTTNISATRPSGPYTLTISGIKPAVQIIGLSIKPDSKEMAPFNPNAQGVIPVALLSSAKFDATQVNQAALTFGSQGTEKSLRTCQKQFRDVNGDGLPDLVCIIDVGVAGFKPNDTMGTAVGQLKDGHRFIGRGNLKVIPQSLEDQEPQQ